MNVSCIILAYNEEKTIAASIRAALGCKSIDEVIVVDDGSTDSTSAVASSYKSVRCFRLSKNRGKGAAYAYGLNKAKHRVVLTVDADLPKIKSDDLKKMIDRYCVGDVDAVIGPQGTTPFFDSITGQRIYDKSIVMPYLSCIEPNRFALEIILNQIFSRRRVAIVPMRNVGHLFKHQRYPLLFALTESIREVWQQLWFSFIIRFELWKEFVKIYKLHPIVKGI